jgi:hypothetical protein
MLDFYVLNKVFEKWRKESISLLPPNKEADVILAFNKIEQKCSADVVSLYCVTGGMENSVMDSNCFMFWSLEKIVQENIAYKTTEFAAFADFLIESHLYYFKFEDKNISSVYTDWSEGGKLIKIADTVNNFFEIYLSNSEKLGLF